MRRSRKRAGSWGLLCVAAALACSCRPVAVQPDLVTLADVAVPASAPEDLNILAVGIADGEGRILLRTTGATVARGSTIDIGVMGPGLVEGTGFLVVGVGIPVRLVRYAMTQGGGIEPMPAAVLSLTVPESAPPGLYSLIVFRGTHYSIFSGGLEVV
ncbi:MAG: hypothetical protein FJ144_19580 [Deltaproteobacteria bacterium]|nr:hypothetical protein [Deltaproteobacteria bacterium]